MSPQQSASLWQIILSAHLYVHFTPLKSVQAAPDYRTASTAPAAMFSTASTRPMIESTIAPVALPLGTAVVAVDLLLVSILHLLTAASITHDSILSAYATQYNVYHFQNTEYQ